MGLLGYCFDTFWSKLLDDVSSGAYSKVISPIKQFRITDELSANDHIQGGIADAYVGALRSQLHQLESFAFKNGSIRKYRDPIHELRAAIGTNRKFWQARPALEQVLPEQGVGRLAGLVLERDFLEAKIDGKDDWLTPLAWNGVVAIVPAFGDDDVFHRMFFEPTTGFMASFAHCFRDKLKEPSGPLFQIVTQEAIASARAEQHEHKEEILAALGKVLDSAWPEAQAVQLGLLEEVRKLSAQLAFDGRPLFATRHLAGRVKPKSQFDSFRFEYLVDDLRGREEDLAAFETDLLAPFEPGKTPSFRWHALCGDAGSGKSRFALELLERVADLWPLSGFLVAHYTNGDVRWLLNVERPVFIVIDYVGGKPGVPDLLEGIAQLALGDALPHPVRVLLIERRRTDPVFERLIQGGGSAAVAAFGPSSLQDIHELQPLSDADLVSLMRSRLGTKPAVDFDDTSLIQRLVKFDPLRRPLFAAIIGDFLRTQSLPDLDKTDTEEDGRWKLLEVLIRRERQSIWEPAHAASMATDHRGFEKILNLAALATMVKGLHVAEHYGLMRADDSRQLAETFPAAQQREIIDMLLLMSGRSTGIAEESEVYPAIEPDLIGECFVLGLMGNSVIRNMLLHAAWMTEPWATADFARRCYQNFPARTARSLYLMPETRSESTMRPRAALVMSFVAEYAGSHEKGTPSHFQQRQILSLYDLLGKDLLDAARTDLEIGRDVAMATAQVINFLARAINLYLGHEAVTIGEKLSMRANMRVLAFNTSALRGSGDVVH